MHRCTCSQAVRPLRLQVGLLAAWHSRSVCWRSWAMSRSVLLLWRSSSFVRSVMSSRPDCLRISTVLRKRRWRVPLPLPCLWGPLVEMEEPDVELQLEETVVELEEDWLSLAEGEFGSPEVMTANLGCFLRCCSGRFTSVSSFLCSVHTLLLRFWDSSLHEDLSGGFLLGCGAMRG